MISRESTERSDLEHTRVHRVAYWNAIASSLSPTRILGRSRFLSLLLETILRWRKRNRYFDTGESGETYDAEMEAAAESI